MTKNKRKAAAPVVMSLVISMAAVAGCTKSKQTPGEQRAEQTAERPIVARGPDEGEERWLGPTSSERLGEGALINIKVDRISVPYTTMLVATQKLAASGIPVHLHTFEDEIIYVVSGRGTALVGPDRQEVPLESGSILYIPTGEWHGVRNADAQSRMEILLVTTPVTDGGLGDYFRNAGVLPGHPPLDLSEKEFLELLTRYGMKIPEK